MQRLFIGTLPEGTTGWTPMLVNTGQAALDVTLAPGAGIYVPALPIDAAAGAGASRPAAAIIDLSTMGAAR